MALTRRDIGVGLLAAGVAGTAGVVAVGPERIEGWITGRDPNAVTLWGFVGGEKEDFLRAENVRALLADKHGVILDARRAGSVEMVSDPALTGQNPLWLWPASGVMTDIARRNGLKVRRDEIVFNTPIVLYTWSPVLDALLAKGWAEERGGAFRLIKAAEFVEAIHAGLTWRDFGVTALYGKASIVSTHPAKSNSGFVFSALLANLFAGDVATMQTMTRDLPRISALFDRMGYKPPSSGVLWNSFLSEGMGGKPLIVGYESQIIEFARREPEKWRALQAGAARPVMIYPEPTVFCGHPILSLSAEADRLIAALLDQDLQNLGWSEHGFRGRLGIAGSGGPRVDGVAESVTSATPLPDADVMLALVAALRGE